MCPYCENLEHYGLLPALWLKGLDGAGWQWAHPEKHFPRDVLYFRIPCQGVAVGEGFGVAVGSALAFGLATGIGVAAGVRTNSGEAGP
jgi:hypothetical protein